MSISASFDANLDGLVAAKTAAVPYRFSAFPFPSGHFQVHAFRGREALSEPYVFDITVTSKVWVGEDLERLALGQRAAFVMSVGGPTRLIPGVVCAVRSDGLRPNNDAAQYTMRLAPSLWLLRRRRNSAIYQDMSVPEVVESVMKRSGIPSRWQLSGHYPARPYCTQFEETDLAFVTRLLAEAGIFYYFASPAGAIDDLVHGLLDAAPGPVGDVAAFTQAALGALVYPEETIVFSDDATHYTPIPDGSIVGAAAAIAGAVGIPMQFAAGPITVGLAAPALHYLSEHGFAVGRADKVTAFQPERSVRSNVTEFRDFDPQRPQTPMVFRAGDRRKAADVLAAAAEGALAEASAELSFDLDDGPSLTASLGAAAMGALSSLLTQRDLEIYDHHGRFHFPDWKEGSEEPARMRRQLRRRAVVARGESLAAALSPGHRFKLEDHPLSPLNREYVVVAVRHRGSVAQERELYANGFECVPANVAYAPKRPKRRAVQTTLTATVAGPTGEEIHVDAAGRIKVLFHWDRRGAANEQASCWLRAMQPWGGAGWGHQFIPRIGMEVVVVFEGGDPDKPIVIGSLYNGTHPPPFALPQNKTRSGVRTQSTPNASGFNELSFEDQATEEQIYLHAQRDLDEVVRRDHTLDVGRDENARVHRDRYDRVDRDRHEDVGGDSDRRVGGNESHEVDGGIIETVGKYVDQRVRGPRVLRVDGGERRQVSGDAQHHYTDDFTARTDGNHTVIVGKHDQKRSFALRVEGSASISSEDGLEFDCPNGITFRCGKSVIRLGGDGMEFVGAMVRLAGEKGTVQLDDKGITSESGGVYMHLDSKLHVQTKASSIVMGAEFKLDAPKILLNSPERATEEPPPPRPEPTHVELCDHEGRPLRGRAFVIELEDGSQRIGVTDKDGKCRLDLPANGRIRFPRLRELRQG